MDTVNAYWIPFWVSLSMIFLAELGDKTQLVSLSLAARFNARVVLAGVFVATLLVHIISVALGGLAGELFPTQWLQFLSGLAFIIFGLWTLRGDSLDTSKKKSSRWRSPFWLITITFFLAEFGDKTMLGTVTLATTYPPVPVWIGSTLGMVLSDGLAIWVGKVLGTRLPERAVKVVAALIFFGFGIASAIQGARFLPPRTWALGGAALIFLAFLIFRRPRER